MGGRVGSKQFRKSMASVQRTGAMRIASSYRTVSSAAVLVFAGVILIDLLAQERKRIYKNSAEIGRAKAAAGERRRTLEGWQHRRNTEIGSRWMRRLIKNLKSWMAREYGDVNFHTTQFLSGHGYFRKYLHRIGKTQTADCRYCGYEIDDAEHTLFACDQWAEERRRMEAATGALKPGNPVEAMLSGEGTWYAVTTFVEIVLRGKNRDGCLTA